MNATTPLRTDGIAFTETHPGYWTVTLGGREEDSRAISKDGFHYIAWIGHASKHWCFSKALKACADDIQWRRDMVVEEQLAHDAAIASLMRMTPAEKERLVDSLGRERDLLDYSDAHVDVAVRKARFDRQIASLRRVGP